MEYDHSPHTFYPNLLAWDFHTLEVSNPNVPPTMEFPLSSDSSTGYLQDAIATLGDRCKRRRVAIFSHDQTVTDSESLIQNYWNCNFNGDPFAADRCWSDNTTIVSGDPLSSSMHSISNGETLSVEMMTEDQATTSVNEGLSSSPSSCKDSVTYNDPDGKESPVSKGPFSSESHCSQRKMTTGKRVTHPFAVVKPGGVEGDVTLADINQRILMRPNRPVRHPVGEFACHPRVSGKGSGLSGKAVIALTRIHTQGRGTVTIIRTRADRERETTLSTQNK